MLERYKISGGKKLRYGITTGTCAAAAAKAAALKLFHGTSEKKISISTPMGWEVEVDIYGMEHADGSWQCYAIKDGGDDPDCTDGMKIYARARETAGGDTVVTGGPGIGKVTRKGLRVDPGNYAINPVPRSMILKETDSVKPEGRGLLIEIYAPGGEEISRKTFNPRLGIVGGISILGTTGIVEPMSNEAVRESLALALSMAGALGMEAMALVPGNYGKKFAIEELGIDIDAIAETGNYIGYMLEQAVYHKMKRILLVGHIGKLVKVAGGIFNTYSKIADARMEILAANYVTLSGDTEGAEKIMASATTEEAMEYIHDTSIYGVLADKAAKKCMEHVFSQLTVEVALFSLNRGLLAKTGGADALIEDLRRGA